MEDNKDWIKYLGPNDTEIYIEVSGDTKDRKDVIRKINRLILSGKQDDVYVESIFVDSSD